MYCDSAEQLCLFFSGCHTIYGLLKSTIHHSPYPAVVLTQCDAEEHCCQPGARFPSYVTIFDTVIEWILSHGDSEIHVCPL